MVNDELYPTDVAYEAVHFTRPNRYATIVLHPQWQKGNIYNKNVVVHDVKQGKFRLKKAVRCEMVCVAEKRHEIQQVDVGDMTLLNNMLSVIRNIKCCLNDMTFENSL